MSENPFQDAINILPSLQADFLRRIPFVLQGLIAENMTFKSSSSNGVFERNTTKKLNISKGDLFRSFAPGSKDNILNVSGKNLQYGSKLPYAAIHEFGGIINHPGSMEVQAWRGSKGELVVTRGTKPHPIPIPQRAYLNPALKALEKELPKLLDEVFKPLQKIFT